MPSTRLAAPEDLSGLAALYQSLRPLDIPLQEDTHAHLLSNQSCDPRTRLVVQDVDGELVATCMLAIVPNLAHGGRPFGLIEHVVTLPAWREQGHARAVLQAALDHAWSANCYKVMLLSGMTLAPAHRLYESVGFRGDVERGFVVKPLSR